MKRFGKKFAMMVTVMMMVLGMAVPTYAAAKYIISGAGGYSVENTTYATYVNTTTFKKTIHLKQSKGVLIYKRVNGSLVNRNSYAKFKVVIKENNKKGKVLKTATWSNGSFKFKGKANKTYFVEVTYIAPVSGEVLIGPMWRQEGWKKNAHWTAKAALF